MFTKLLSASVFASVFASVAFGADDVINWDFNHQAIAVGSGCHSRPFTDAYGQQSEDTFFVTAGNEFSVVFSVMGVNLADFGSPLAKRTSCTVRVPVQISRGLYIGELTQTISYGVTKSANTSGDLTARAAFFGLPAANIVKSFPRGHALDQSMMTVTQKQDYLVNTSRNWFDYFCKSPGLTGRYDINLGVTGNRPNYNESIVVQIDGADIKFDAIAGVYRCALPRPR